MSLYVFDTDTLTLYRQSHPAVARNIIKHLSDDLATTAINVEEQLSGWYTMLRRVKQPPDEARAYQELADSVRLLATFLILPYPVSAIARYEQLLTMKLQVRKMDLRIAAIVLEHQGVLVTRNARDFQRVPGLVIEDWTK
jgi:tRNA(fMet)-specific endonuclease VapC